MYVRAFLLTESDLLSTKLFYGKAVNCVFGLEIFEWICYLVVKVQDCLALTQK